MHRRKILASPGQDISSQPSQPSTSDAGPPTPQTNGMPFNRDHSLPATAPRPPPPLTRSSSTRTESDPSTPGSWDCPQCTFHNPPGTVTCRMCQLRNPSVDPDETRITISQAPTLTNTALGSAPPPRPDWLPTSGPAQLTVPPERWALTVRQFRQILQFIRHTDHYRRLQQEHGQVNMYLK